MVRPSPPDFHSPGDIASWVTNRSCSRPGPDSPTSYVASSTLACSRRRLREQASVLDATDRKSTRLNSSHVAISYAVFCLKKKKQHQNYHHTLLKSELLHS